ncbi:hypothetical protein QFZ77_003944 [Paenibacillus sp. V4I3]|uniref:hypothetical protein n=1 Tax=unclassified Paenibacillus TaxID=185978 RepID=UPI002783656D|nr:MULTISPECIES: hypothetical protein [unclassified Paenibacillus]MDQ0875285.1 hypothetical protein [Paenibacillus sp. V4I3]MDQ0888983.1 hypothetical protein [Paenibacillus sp. V4I9]
MKRLVNMITVLMLFMALMACTSVPVKMDSVTNQPTAPNKTQSNGKKVLFVGRDSGGDAIVTKRLKEVHGFEVTVIADKEVTPEKANGYTLIFVSESVNSGKIRDNFVKAAVPVIYAEPQSTSDTGMTVTDGYGKLDAGNVAKTIQIKDSKHQLAAGLENQVDVYKANGKMGFATPGAEAIVVATVPNEEQKATIFAYEKGVKNAKDQPVVAREVFFYLFNGEEINQTESGWKLFDAAIKWATGKK